MEQTYSFTYLPNPNKEFGNKDEIRGDKPYKESSLDPKLPTGVLSDRDIRREIAAGNIILHDPDRDCTGNIQNCSVDITLGPYFYRNEHPIPFFNPWSAQHVHDYWGSVQEASVASEVNAPQLGLKVGEQYILLSPGESILAHTREFIGGLNNITTMVKSRSSMGRSNVTICRDAGWGDCGYYNRWTLEITNNSTSPIVLPIGARIGQIIFFYMGIPDTVYSGKYQTSFNLKEVVDNWSPSMLLPKLHLEK
ncbi:DUTP diphosphatase [uncultured virus]|nr:DUTP diphosphatase [uncultured virus]